MNKPASQSKKLSRRKRWFEDHPPSRNGGCSHQTAAVKKLVSPQSRIGGTFNFLPHNVVTELRQRGDRSTDDSQFENFFLENFSTFAGNRRQRNHGIDESSLEDEGISVFWIEKLFEEGLRISSDSEEDDDPQTSIRRPSNVRPRTRQWKRLMEENETEQFPKNSKKELSTL